MTSNTVFTSVGRVAAVLALLAVTGWRQIDSVSAQTGSSECPAYEIEGSIEPMSDEGAAPQVAVYLHIGAEPVAGHRVFATFTNVDGVEVGEAMVLTTGEDGRAAAPVPEGAVSVSFVAESPDQPACLAISGSEPSVSLEIRVATGNPENPGPEGQLAHTGPVTAGVAATAVLAAALGCGVWMGRGRKVSGHELASSRG